MRRSALRKSWCGNPGGDLCQQLDSEEARAKVKGCALNLEVSRSRS